jgi:hypothetical protein
MAVEMVYMATVPYAYDIAVMIGGDKDFLPALDKTRALAKSVALCSMRNSCNRELWSPSSRSRDFQPIWLDDAIDVIFERIPEKPTGNIKQNLEELLLHRILEVLLDAIFIYLARFDSLLMLGFIVILCQIIFTYYDPHMLISSRDLGRQLSLLELDSEQRVLDVIRSQYGSLKSFLEKYQNIFLVSQPLTEQWEFSISLVPEVADKLSLGIPDNLRLTDLESLLGGNNRNSSDLLQKEEFFLELILKVCEQMFPCF